MEIIPDIDLQFLQNDWNVFIPIVAGLIGFIIFWFSHKSEKLKNKLIERFGPDWGPARHIIYTKILGAVSIGLLPTLFYLIAFPETKLGQLGLGLPKDHLFSTLFWIVVLSLLLIFVTARNAKNVESLKNYPQIRASRWTRQMYLANLAAWAIYLLGYEFFFRGLLLFPLVEQLGLWPAIAINIGLYSATHIPKGLSEAIGAIPLSVVLCILTVSTGTIWIAFFVHLAMAWTNTIVSFKLHDDMSIIKNK